MRAALAWLVALAAWMLAGPAPALAAEPDPLLGAVAAAEQAGTLPADHAAIYRDILARARATRDAAPRGRPGREMAAVLRIAERMARRGQVTRPRMPGVFLTLLRNVEWWSVNATPPPGSPGEPGARRRVCSPALQARAARVQFPGSDLVFQYYRGIGLQLQVNASFARANALLAAPDGAVAARGMALLDELAGLAVPRGRFLAWEYLFPAGGGEPPWVSALSQATAIQALTRAAQRLGRHDLLALATQAVGAFSAAPPQGVGVRLDRDGSWFALYSFAPGLRVLNAQLQAVSALFDVAQASGDPLAAFLHREGLRATRRRIGSFDTGAWSRYAAPGRLADLNYHVLNRDLARAVCRRTGEAAVCRAATRFAVQLERRCPRIGRA